MKGFKWKHSEFLPFGEFFPIYFYQIFRINSARMSRTSYDENEITHVGDSYVCSIIKQGRGGKRSKLTVGKV